MRGRADSAAAPAAKCRNCLRWGSFIAVPPSLICLFDHLVGAGEQRRWNIEVHGLCSGEVDHQIKLCRHLNRKIGWLRALENPADINASAAKSIRLAWSVADQAANFGILALIIDRWQGMSARQGHEVPALAQEEWTSADE